MFCARECMCFVVVCLVVCLFVGLQSLHGPSGTLYLCIFQVFLHAGLWTVRWVAMQIQKPASYLHRHVYITFFYPTAKVYAPTFKLRPCSICYKTCQTIHIMYILFSRNDKCSRSVFRLIRFGSIISGSHHFKARSVSSGFSSVCFNKSKAYVSRLGTEPLYQIFTNKVKTEHPSFQGMF